MKSSIDFITLAKLHYEKLSPQHLRPVCSKRQMGHVLEAFFTDNVLTLLLQI